ncbi:unnamed protein product [Camellia sinensis]
MYDSAVLSSVTLMLFACVVWLNLVSYAHTNYDMRALAESLDKIVSATGIPDGWMGLDIGPDSIKTFNDALDSTKTVIWNGPMGVFEFEKFAAGTEAIAKKLAELSGKGVTTIIGGGDSVAAVEKVGVADVMSHISTGGGASLELLEGKELPGVLALDEATLKAPVMQIKEGLNVRPKCTMLEKAIRELEKMVAESRPPTMEGQDADISSQAVKRRLPHEVKQKLAKVARLAQANHGKISMELVNRLMSIVGHMVQLRTLEIEQGILDLLALDSISGGGHANVNLFPNVDSSWKVCLSTVERQGYKLYKEKKSRAVPYDSGGTDIYGGKTRLASLAVAFPNLDKKETLLKPSELLPFQNHSSQMAALDYIVSVESDIFVPTYGGNMALVVEGHRRVLQACIDLKLGSSLLDFDCHFNEALEKKMR